MVTTLRLRCRSRLVHIPSSAWVLLILCCPSRVNYVSATEKKDPGCAQLLSFNLSRAGDCPTGDQTKGQLMVHRFRANPAYLVLGVPVLLEDSSEVLLLLIPLTRNHSPLFESAGVVRANHHGKMRLAFMKIAGSRWNELQNPNKGPEGVTKEPGQGVWVDFPVDRKLLTQRAQYLFMKGYTLHHIRIPVSLRAYFLIQGCWARWVPEASWPYD